MATLKKLDEKIDALAKVVGSNSKHIASLVGNVTTLVESVTFMKNNMVTQTEFKKEIGDLKEKITAVERSLGNRLDNELDKRGHLEARVTKLEVARR
jgi:prophage DNA circulation protein